MGAVLCHSMFTNVLDVDLKLRMLLRSVRNVIVVYSRKYSFPIFLEMTRPDLQLAT
jgi:hypothetical protein